MNTKNHSTKEVRVRTVTDKDIAAAFDFSNLKKLADEGMARYIRDGDEQKINAAMRQEKVALAA